VALVKNNEMLPSKPKNETQSDDEKRKKQNKRCSASKLKRQKRGQLGAIKGHVFAKCGGSNPTCTSAPGNAQKSEEAKAWLQKQDLYLCSTRKAGKKSSTMEVLERKISERIMCRTFTRVHNFALRVSYHKNAKQSKYLTILE
jgi:hypothetical protein